MKFLQALRLQSPNAAAKRCEKCAAWWVPFTTKVEQSGWTLCRQCHDGDPKIRDLELVPWEQRRIRFLGFKGEPFYDNRHYKTIDDED